MNTQPKVVSLDSHPGRNAVNERVKAKKLIDAFQEQSSRYARSLMQQMFDSADDRLFEMAEKADNNTDQSVYFDSMRIVRLKRKDIETAYCRNIKQLFENFGKPDTSASRMPEEEIDLSCENLSLMEEVDLEESLAISTLTNKIRSNLAQEIHAIEQRLGQISPGIRIDQDSNPLDPQNLCGAFKEATELLDTDIKIKLIIFKLFDQHISETIGSLYQFVNNSFIEAGILPKIRLQAPSRPGGAAAPVTGTTASSLDASSMEPQGTAMTDGFDPLATAGGGEVLVPLQQLLAQTGLAGTPATGMGGAATGNTAGVAVSSTPQVLSALSRMQSIPASGIPAGGSPREVSAQIKTMLVDQVSEVAGQPVNLNSVDNGIIDIVSMLFEFILDDENLPSAAKAEIARLQIPMLKVAVIDREFFSTQGHPARVLLNSLAKAGIGLDESATRENSPVIQEIEQAVETIINEFDNEVGIFNRVLEDFTRFMEQERERETSAEASALAEFQHKEEVALAQAWVRETLDEVLADKMLPEQIDRIIRGPWRDVMLHTYLNEGENSPLWKNQLRFIDVLAWSVEPKKAPLDRKKLGNIIRQLIGTLREGLARIDYPRDKTDKLFNALEAWHLASLRGLLPQEDTQADVAMSSIREQDPEASFFLFEEPDTDTGTEDEDPLSRIDRIEQDLDVLAQTDVSSGIASVTEHASGATNSEVQQTIADMEQQVASLSELEDMLNEVLEDDSDTGGEDREIMEDIVLSSWEEPDAGDSYPEDEYLDIARHLEAGKWVEFFDENGNAQRAKLAWKSDLLGEYTFLNWKFDVVADKTLFGLAADLRSGRARVVDDIPILDRALTAVLSGIRRSA